MINQNSKLEINNTVFEFDHETGVLWVKAGLLVELFANLEIGPINDNGFCDFLDNGKMKMFCRVHEAMLINAYYKQQKAIFNENKALEVVA